MHYYHHTICNGDGTWVSLIRVHETYLAAGWPYSINYFTTFFFSLLLNISSFSCNRCKHEFSPLPHMLSIFSFSFSRSWKSHQLFYSFNQSSYFKGLDHWLIACWEFYRVQSCIGLDSVRFEQHVSIDLNFSAWVQTFVFCMKVLL